MEITDLRSYMEFSRRAIGDKAYEAVVLKHGKEFSAPATPRPKGIRKGRDKMCFRNTFLLCVDYGYTYVEGFATSVIPVHHAWAYNPRTNTVIETTWKDAGIAYYGIPFDIDFVMQVMIETGVYGVIDYRSQIFKNKYLEE